MSNTANFIVDTKLTEVFGLSYNSSEKALKELIDNAYDADAENVYITIPAPLDNNPIIEIIDDGVGMNEKEVREEYLRIASSRFSRKGELTELKQRKVKGRKGIGKFAGLTVATNMLLNTKSNGILTSISINKNDILSSNYKIDEINIPISTSECPNEKDGTSITLEGLNQNLAYPNPDNLISLIVTDFRWESDFNIFINKKKIGIDDIKGNYFNKALVTNNGHNFNLLYTVSEKKLTTKGIVFRVNGKIVGKPYDFLADEENIPSKLKKQIIGEIVCDNYEDFVTRGWDEINENSIIFQNIRELVKVELLNSISEKFTQVITIAKARYQHKINKELEKLPEHRREFTEKKLYKIIEKFYGESEDKINTIISVVIDTLEKDYYWSLIQDINATDDSDIGKIATILSDLALNELAIVAEQVKYRLNILGKLDKLILNDKTLEVDMHKVIENNTWILGNKYSLMFSNTSLKKMINKKFIQNIDDSDKRPDLMLSQNYENKYLLIEFKRPNFKIGRDAEHQLLKYLDEVKNDYGDNIEAIAIGGKIDSNISQKHNNNITYMTYAQLVSNSRHELQWLFTQLNNQFNKKS